MVENCTTLRSVSVDDIPPEFHDIVNEIGLDAFLSICRLVGGLAIYFPKMESLERNGRDREIRSRFDGGNYKQLAKMFRLSERQIRKIINGERR